MEGLRVVQDLPIGQSGAPRVGSGSAPYHLNMNQYLVRVATSLGRSQYLQSPLLVCLLLAGWLGVGGALSYGALNARSDAGQHSFEATDVNPRSETELANTAPEPQSGASQSGGPNSLDEPESTNTSISEVSDKSEPTVATNDDESTNAQDDRSLGGQHGLTSDLIGWETWGTATVLKNTDGSYLVEGSQIVGNESLTINGTLRPAKSEDGNRELVFDGVIESQTSSYAGGAPCLRVGQMTFVAPESKQYWRLVEPQSPCGSYTERIDLYFADL